MTILDAIILGAVQGFTEFLPISSSGHLIIVEDILKLDVQELKVFDIALHFGTLLSIFLYFRKDFIKYGITLLKLILRKKTEKSDRDSILFLLVGTLPAIIVGLTLGDLIDYYFRGSSSVAIMLILVGIWFFGAEAIYKRSKKRPLCLKGALLIGICQAFALIPGVSRSGITISAGMAYGVERAEAAKYSFILGSIATTAAVILTAYRAFMSDDIFFDPLTLFIGVLISMIAGLLAIGFLLYFLKNHSMNSFGIYRIILGIILLTHLY